MGLGSGAGLGGLGGCAHGSGSAGVRCGSEAGVVLNVKLENDRSSNNGSVAESHVVGDDGVSLADGDVGSGDNAAAVGVRGSGSLNTGEEDAVKAAGGVGSRDLEGASGRRHCRGQVGSGERREGRCGARRAAAEKWSNERRDTGGVKGRVLHDKWRVGVDEADEAVVTCLSRKNGTGDGQVSLVLNKACSSLMSKKCQKWLQARKDN